MKHRICGSDAFDILWISNSQASHYYLSDLAQLGIAEILDVIDWEEGLYFIQMNVANGKRRFAKVIVAGK